MINCKALNECFIRQNHKIYFMKPQTQMRNQLFTIIPKKLYFVISESVPKTEQDALYFNIDDELCYEPFNEDFGPINISNISKFVKQLAQLIQNPQRQQVPIFFHTGTKKIQYTNAVLLICSFLVLHLKKKPEEAFEIFKKYAITPFRDIDTKNCLYECTILDCLKALHMAVKIEWFSMDTFDSCSYDTFSSKDDGNINELIPNKVFVFKEPPMNRINQYGNVQITYKDYLTIFSELKINKIISLVDKPSSSSKQIEKMLALKGIKYSQICLKELNPSSTMADGFIEEIQNTEENQRVAVSCSNGLGKSCTLIGCYAIKHYVINAKQYIAWARMVRPGAIIGPQQFFLLDYEDYFRKGGEDSPIRLKIARKIEISAEQERELTKQQNRRNNSSMRSKRSNSLKHTKPKKSIDPLQFFFSSQRFAR